MSGGLVRLESVCCFIMPRVRILSLRHYLSKEVVMIDPSWEVDVPSVLAMESVRIIDIRTDDEVLQLHWQVRMSIFPWIAC